MLFLCTPEKLSSALIFIIENPGIYAEPISPTQTSRDDLSDNNAKEVEGKITQDAPSFFEYIYFESCPG